MKTPSLLFICFLLYSCQVQHPNLIGTYKSNPKYSLLHYLGKREHFAIGSTIILNSDSSFNYETCGNVLKGYWKLNNDSLILNVISNRYRIDSLNYTWPKLKISVLKFRVIKDILIFEDRINNNGKTYKFTHLLKKI